MDRLQDRPAHHPSEGGGAGAAGPAPRLRLSSTFPREAASVPAVRHLAAQTLRAAGVTGPDLDAVKLAVTEACANVVEHAVDAETYDVLIALSADQCTIGVVDQGAGFDPGAVVGTPAPMAEGGRGLELMRALSDELCLDARPAAGAAVRMVMRLGSDAGGRWDGEPHAADQLVGERAIQG